MRIVNNKRKFEYLNAFAGFGGNTELLDRDRIRVSHIERDPKRINYLKENFPDDIIYPVDAYEYVRDYYDMYDFVWCSPPCQSFSKARRKHHKEGNRKLPDVRMYSLILYLDRWSVNPYVVENVIGEYELLLNPNTVGRHLVWSNYPILNRKFPVDNIQNAADKNMRNKMNPEIGKYIFESRLMKSSLLEWIDHV